MAAIVVPFRGSGAKARLAALADPARGRLALAMLGDVLEACSAIGETTVVTEDVAARAVARELGSRTVTDPGGGQGNAVAAALGGLDAGTILVVNADLPCVLPHDLRRLLGAIPLHGIALAAARDGTTNALGLPTPQAFAPLFGSGSAARFRAHAQGLGLEVVSTRIPNLADDVDTLDDLRRIGFRAGPRTQAVISSLGLAA